MDVIDIGHKVFDRLIAEYGEDPDSRLLFLAGCMAGFDWHVINSDKKLIISEVGVSANFNDDVINQINIELKEIQRIKDEEVAKNFAKELSKGRDKFKDGDTYHFWGDDSNNTNINIKF